MSLCSAHLLTCAQMCDVVFVWGRVCALVFVVHMCIFKRVIVHVSRFPSCVTSVAARTGRAHPTRSPRFEDAPSITAVIPCYLPNEQYIIEETVEWIMRQVESPGPLEVLVVYNTPKDLPDIEARLKELEVDGTWPEGRHFRAMRVQESKSKAANLNAALRTVKDVPAHAPAHPFSSV